MKINNISNAPLGTKSAKFNHFLHKAKLAIAPAVVAGALLSPTSLKAQDESAAFYEMTSFSDDGYKIIHQMFIGLIAFLGTLGICSELAEHRAKIKDKEYLEKNKLKLKYDNYRNKFIKANPDEYLRSGAYIKPDKNGEIPKYKKGLYQFLGNNILKSGGVYTENVAIAFNDAPDDILKEISYVYGMKGSQKDIINNLKDSMYKSVGKLFLLSLNIDTDLNTDVTKNIGKILKNYYDKNNISIKDVAETENFHINEIAHNSDSETLNNFISELKKLPNIDFDQFNLNNL